MRGIKELRQRVLAAEERVGLNDAQRTEYSERLVALMNDVEGRIGDQHGKIKKQITTIKKCKAEAVVQQAKIDGQGTAIAQQAEAIEKFKATVARKSSENEQLRAMLQSMLQTIESDGRDGLAEAMQDLDRKVCTLMSAATAEPEAEEYDEPIADSSIEVAIAVGPVTIGSLADAEDAPYDEIVAETGYAAMDGPFEDEDIAVIEAREAAMAESAAEEIDEPATEEIAEPVAEDVSEPDAEVEDEAPAVEEIEEPVTEEIAEPVAEEIEEPVAETETEELAAEAEAEEPAAEELAAEAESEAEEPAAEAEEPAAEEIAEPVAEESEESEEVVPLVAANGDGGLLGSSLDEIMERVSKLVEETEAAIAAPEPCAPEAAPEAPGESLAEDLVEDILEEPAQRATA